MRLYTAAPFRTYERVRRFNADARAAGHAVMHDWTLTEEFGADGHPLFGDGATLDMAVKAERAEEDRLGVELADLVILLGDQGPSFGACMEAGMAVAYEKRLFVVGPTHFTIFWGLTNVTVLPDENAARDALGMRALEERRDVFVSPTAARHGLGVPVEHTMLVRENES
jgi:hypothetical protein